MKKIFNASEYDFLLCWDLASIRHYVKKKTFLKMIFQAQEEGDPDLLP